MSARDAYLYYQAGQAVAAAHLGLKVRHVSADPATAPTDIVLTRSDPKPRMILWLTGMAAEKKGVGRSDPLRRTRNRARIRTLVESVMVNLSGARGKRLTDAKSLLNQAQDRANAICSDLYEAIDQVVAKLRLEGAITGEQVQTIVRAVKAKRAAAGQPTLEEASAPEAVRPPEIPPPELTDPKTASM